MTNDTHATRCSRRRSSRNALAALTLARLLLVPVLVATFMIDPLLTTACLLVFMVADLYDGVLARKLRADGPQRRAIDSIVDRIAIDSCLIAALVVKAMPAILVIGFLARDLYCALICARMIRERGVAIKADVLYRGLNCLIAVWAMSAPFLSSDERGVFAAAVFACSIGVAFDLQRAVRRVRQAPREITDRVIAVAVLRSGPLEPNTHSARRHGASARTPAVTVA